MARKIWRKVPETIKMNSTLEIRMCLSPLCKIFSTCWFVYSAAIDVFIQIMQNSTYFNICFVYYLADINWLV